MLWTTKEGKTLDIKDMTDSHLLFSHRLISERRITMEDAIESAWSFSSMLQGEMALVQIDRDIDRLEDMSWNINKIETTLKKEIDKRGLTPLPLRKEK